jgi:hypothetical protein
VGDDAGKTPLLLACDGAGENRERARRTRKVVNKNSSPAAANAPMLLIQEQQSYTQ